MASPNNMDWGRVFSKLFGGAPSGDEARRSVERADPEVGAVVAAAQAVHAELGFGFLPAVYADALQIEFEAAGVPFERNAPLPLTYRGRQLHSGYTADFICHGNILVLVRSLPELRRGDDQELVNHLKMTGSPRGVTLNFGPERLDFRRVAAFGSAGSGSA